MNKAYATCETYQDTGMVTCGDRHMKVKTFFKRPNRLYVEFSGSNVHEGRYVLWMHGALKSQKKHDIKENRQENGYMKAHTWDSSDREIETDDLGMELAGFTGISLGGATTIPGFLFPKHAYGWNPDEVSDLKFEKVEMIGKVACDVLYSKEKDVRYWIAKDLHLLLKQDESLGDRNVLTWSPKVGTKIPDSQFLFTPPKK